MRRVALVSAFVALASCKQDPPSGAVDASLATPIASASATPDAATTPARCATPTALTLVGTINSPLRWVGDVLVDYEDREVDLKTLAIGEVHKWPDAKPSVRVDGGVVTIDTDAGLLSVSVPAGARYGYTDDDRWVSSTEPDGGVLVTDAKTGLTSKRAFWSACCGRGVVRDGQDAVVIDVPSDRELFRASGCKSEQGYEFPYSLSKRGKFLECQRDGIRSTLWSVDDLSHPSLEVDAQIDFVAPSEAYAVGVPILASRLHPVARNTVEYRPLPGIARTIAPRPRPLNAWSTASVTFCGDGELFAVTPRSVIKPGAWEGEVLLFRGKDGAFVARAPVKIPNGDHASFDASGNHLILSNVLPPPLMTVGATYRPAGSTTLYRLEHGAVTGSSPSP